MRLLISKESAVTRIALLTARAIIVLAIVVAAIDSVRARQEASPFDAVVESARKELQETHTPGATLALIDGDRVVFSTGVGVADIETATPMRPEMLFRLGSTTKMFTAATVVTLAEQGKVTLDAAIGSVITELDPSIARLTPKQLLSHTAGLRDEAPMFGKHDDEALGNGVKAMKADMLFTEPGSIYSYSNPGYWIAGFVAEQIAGKPYADAVQELVFAPLGMTRSTFRPMMAITYPLAQGHEAAGNQSPAVIRPAANNVATWPAGSMFSNVHDLSRFVIAFMNDGRIDGREALKPGVIAALMQPQVTIPGGTESYGFGLQVARRADFTVVSHGGSRAGYGSTIMMVPSRRIAAIALGNRSGSGLPRTTRRAMEMLLRTKEGALATPTSTTEQSATDSGVDPKMWTGRYSQGTSNLIEIVATEQGLAVRRANREQPARPQGKFRLLVGADSGDGANSLVLVPDGKGQPAYVFAGGRAFRRMP
jgi:CubicO group peptidase (beta-lactamase class C family)